MSSGPSIRATIIATALFLGTGCTTFNSLEAATEREHDDSSTSESATFGAGANVDTAGGAAEESQDEVADAPAASPSVDGGVAPTTPEVPATGGGLCATAASDPTAAATVGSYLDKIASGAPTGALRTRVIDAVVRACDAFAPTGAGWQRRYCWAHLTSEILKESTFRPTVSVTDAYATRAIGSQTANDPTVGLMQIRFSSVVHDFVAKGPADRLACIGCTLPSSLTAHVSEAGNSSFWAVTGPSANRALVEDVACNIGFGAWYVYLNATGNGNTSKPTYVADYCAGQGTAANLVTGLRTFLEGPSAVHGFVEGNSYVSAIKTTFDTMVGTVTGTHPFYLTLSPSRSTYCR